MIDATVGMFFIGVLVLFLGTALAVRRSMRNRRRNEAPFRGYFASGNYCDRLRHSHLSEAENWSSDLQSRFTPFRLRNPRIDQFGDGARHLIDQDSETH